MQKKQLKWQIKIRVVDTFQVHKVSGTWYAYKATAVVNKNIKNKLSRG